MNIPIPIIPNFPNAVQIPHCNVHGSPNGIQGEIQSSGKSMSSSPVGGYPRTVLFIFSIQRQCLAGLAARDWLGGGVCCVDMSKMC